MSEGFKRFHYKFQKNVNVMHRFAGSAPFSNFPGSMLAGFQVSSFRISWFLAFLFQVSCFRISRLWCPTASVVSGSWPLEVAGSSSEEEPQWEEEHLQHNPSEEVELLALLPLGSDPHCRPCGQTCRRPPTLQVPSLSCFLCKL